MFSILYNLREKNASHFREKNVYEMIRRELDMLEILWEDQNLIVVHKPVGMESQSSRGFSADMVSEIKRHIHKLSPTPREPYVGVIHRLDKPVSGILVYAKTQKAAAELCRQVSNHEMTKKYKVVLCGNLVDKVDNFVDYLLKDSKTNCSRIVDKGITGAKRAELVVQKIKTLETESYGILTLAEVTLLTGRHHQIRVQMAGHGLPLWGDNKYNPFWSEATDHRYQRDFVALAACELTFKHPVTGSSMTFRREPEGKIFQRFC